MEPDGTNRPHRYPNVWDIQATTGPSRVVAAPSSQQVDCMIDLARCLQEPYWILVVLLVSRRGHEPGRYQSPAPLDRDQAETFLRTHADFFEHDGRAHVWLTGGNDDGTIVYDNHNLLYAYGPTDSYVEALERRSLQRGGVRIPAPHTHNYNAEHDDGEDSVFNAFEWLHFPLQPDDDR